MNLGYLAAGAVLLLTGCGGAVPEHPCPESRCATELRQATHLEANHSYGAALAHLIESVRWCREERNSPALGTIPDRMARLATVFAPARTELRALQTDLLRGFDVGGLETRELSFLAKVNAALSDEAANERIFQAGDAEQKRTLWLYVAAAWLDGKRYDMFLKYPEYAEGEFDSFLAIREHVRSGQAGGRLPPGDEVTAEVLRIGAELVEAFVGAGDRGRADAALARLLKVDSSPDAWAIVIKRVRRLGPEAESEYRVRAMSQLGADHAQELARLLED